MGKRLVAVLLGLACAWPPSGAEAQTPLKIGVLTELSGSFGPSGSNERDGFLLYLKQAGGRFAGRPVTTVIEDSAGDPATAISKAKKLIESDRIDLLVGPMSSGTGAAIKPYVTGRKMPTLISSTVDEIADGKYFFRTSFTANAAGYLDGYVTGKAGFKKAVTIAPNYAAGQSSIAYMEKGLNAIGGTVLQKLMPRVGIPDYGSFIAQFSPEADAAIVFLPGNDGVRFIKQYAGYGKKLPLFGAITTVDEANLPAEGKDAEGFIGPETYVSSIDTPANKTFVAAWQQAYHSVPTWTAVSGYVAGQAIDDALKRTAGKTDAETLLPALKETRLQTPAGAFRFDADNNPIGPRYLVQIRDIAGGHMEPVVFAVIAEASSTPEPPKLPPDLVFPR